MPDVFMTPNAYTVGLKSSYDRSLEMFVPGVVTQLGDEDPRYVHRPQKSGKEPGYDGGWVWRTEEEARAFLAPTEGLVSFDGKPPVLCDVYGLVLSTGWETDVSSGPGPDGVHRLLTTSPLVLLSR